MVAKNVVMRKRKKNARNNIPKSINGKEYGEEYDNEEDATNEDFYEIPILQFEPINFDDNLIHEDKRGVSGYVE